MSTVDTDKTINGVSRFVRVSFSERIDFSFNEREQDFEKKFVGNDE